MNYEGAAKVGHGRWGDGVSDAVAEQAQEWVRRLLSGEATQTDALDLAVWRKTDPRHEAAFIHAARLHDLARRASAELRAEATQVSAKRPLLNRRLVLGGAVAASAGGVAVLLSVDGLRTMTSTADYETTKGETRTLQLAPGVSVELNTLTKISLRRQAGEGSFDLMDGEAVVTIDRPKTPLSIFARNGETRATQARLALRCLDGAVRVSCLEGGAIVRVGDQTARLEERRSVTYDRRRLAEPAPVDPAVEAAWRRGLLVFRDERLGDVIEEINRYRDGRIVIADPRLRSRRVNGTFHTDRVDQILDQLRLAYGVKASQLPGGVVLVA